MRDAEGKGFVKISDAVAGITVDWKVRPLTVIDVRGTAAAAGVRKGDILLELDGPTTQIHGTSGQWDVRSLQPSNGLEIDSRQEAWRL